MIVCVCLCASRLRCLCPRNSVTDCWGSEKIDTVCDSVAESIGPLINRPALRTLAIKIPEREIVNESIENLIKCPKEKPKLERLILSPTVPLSSIYEFVNENFNLKSLTIDTERFFRRTKEETVSFKDMYRSINMYHNYIEKREEDTKKTINGLIRIFNCNNGLDEIDLLNPSFLQIGLYFDSSFDFPILIWKNKSHGKIYRSDFSSMVPYLARVLAEREERIRREKKLAEESKKCFEILKKKTRESRNVTPF